MGDALTIDKISKPRTFPAGLRSNKIKLRC
jgi:hypothetical protein